MKLFPTYSQIMGCAVISLGLERCTVGDLDDRHEFPTFLPIRMLPYGNIKYQSIPGRKVNNPVNPSVQIASKACG